MNRIRVTLGALKINNLLLVWIMVIQQSTLKRDEALRVLVGCKQGIVVQYGVTELGLFGSIARYDATGSSNVDVVVQSDAASPP